MKEGEEKSKKSSEEYLLLKKIKSEFNKLPTQEKFRAFYDMIDIIEETHTFKEEFPDLLNNFDNLPDRDQYRYIFYLIGVIQGTEMVNQIEAKVTNLLKGLNKFSPEERVRLLYELVGYVVPPLRWNQLPMTIEGEELVKHFLSDFLNQLEKLPERDQYEAFSTLVNIIKETDMINTKYAHIETKFSTLLNNLDNLSGMEQYKAFSTLINTIKETDVLKSKYALIETKSSTLLKNLDELSIREQYKAFSTFIYTIRDTDVIKTKYDLIETRLYSLLNKLEFYSSSSDNLFFAIKGTELMKKKSSSDLFALKYIEWETKEKAISVKELLNSVEFDLELMENNFEHIRSEITLEKLIHIPNSSCFRVNPFKEYDNEYFEEITTNVLDDFLEFCEIFFEENFLVVCYILKNNEIIELAINNREFSYNSGPRLNELLSMGWLNSLETLSLDACFLVDLALILDKLKSLRALHISYSNDNLSELPDSVLDLKFLRELNISYIPLKSIPESIGNLKSLLYLAFTHSELTELPKSIGELSSLRSLILSDTKIKALPESIGNLQALQYLNLRNTELIELPNSIGNLKSLIELNLSHTKIKSLPESIGNLQALLYLNLSNTDLIEIPDSIGNLKSLIELNLSHTKIKSLPESIANLESLKELDISHSKMYEPTKIINKLQAIKNLKIKAEVDAKTTKENDSFRWFWYSLK